MSEPKILSSLGRTTVMAAQSVSEHVRLVGGTGLACILGHRHSEDVDLFAARDEVLRPVVDAVERAAEGMGASVRRVRTTPHYVRLEIDLDDETLRVDVANDTAARLEDPVVIDDMRVESLRDQRANKIAALLGRSELRDLVDLYFIERAGVPFLEGIEDATRKDAGMDAGWLAWSIDQVQVASLVGMIEPLDLDDLELFRARLRDALLDYAGANR